MSVSEEEVRGKLAAYLENNSYSEVSKGNDGIIFIATPWGDKTIGLVIPDDSDKQYSLFESLNGSTLPEKYSAIYHRDTKKLEVIWTAYHLNSASAETAEREFEFLFGGNTHKCWFGEASQRLMSIAACAEPVSNSNATNYRNLTSFMLLQRTEDGEDGHHGGRALSTPRSFYIDLGELDWEEIDNLVIHLNAFMSYYDTKTPQVLIHEPIAKDFSARDRYLHGEFPKKISGREIDINALNYWREATLSGNEIVTFLTCYRIIEYLAFHFIESQTRSRIKKILSSPHAHSKIDATMRSVVEALSAKSATDDIPKAQNLITETINMELLWTEITRHKKYFCTPTNFDGGYAVKSLITEKDSLETFSNNGVRNTFDRLRGIRNALSHGQDQQTRSVIRPTAHNRRLIRPWLNLIEIIAGEAMLNSEVV
ncbi:hypothetical protein AYJ57_15730 [Salipiger sp. CCB-MM3]|uniref:hypothetical protein n=1 Tax=Salipiger sp. CCB-MM3 TaxID=1792508 RepID=UPI00080AACB3|nr:hypothetical protein [Salipiger sp. CCB-MM3]ANT61906.1 hypothetical protein AYJ57_15730 [Salipiger sp. CCB-MM3]